MSTSKNIHSFGITNQLRQCLDGDHAIWVTYRDKIAESVKDSYQRNNPGEPLPDNLDKVCEEAGNIFLNSICGIVSGG